MHFPGLISDEDEDSKLPESFTAGKVKSEKPKKQAEMKTKGLVSS